MSVKRETNNHFSFDKLSFQNARCGPKQKNIAAIALDNRSDISGNSLN